MKITKKRIAKKLLQLALHITFWTGVLLFYTYFFGYNTANFSYVLSFSTFLMPITIATTYFSIYKLLPNYFLTKRYFKFCLYTVYTLIISSYLIIFSIFYGLIYLSKFNYQNMPLISRNILFVMIGVYLVVILVSAFKLLKLNHSTTTKNSKLQSKILETQLKLKEQELNYLKMQIQPHFLFNTLNTMYGFALKKADETPEMILKLSNLLDYLLYEIDKPKVGLLKEIEHINDYIALEKMRFNNSLLVSFNKNTIPETATISPMLLLPFIENSFKHGTLINGVLHVGINLKYSKNAILFSVKNSALRNEKTSYGIGLKNAKKRLEILYPNAHNLMISQNDNSFTVNLTLNTVLND